MSELTCMVCELRSILISTDASASGMEKMPQHKAQAPRMARMKGSFGGLARPAPEGTLISQVSCKSQSSSKVYKKYCLCCGEQRCLPRAAVNFSSIFHSGRAPYGWGRVRPRELGVCPCAAARLSISSSKDWRSRREAHRTPTAPERCEASARRHG